MKMKLMPLAFAFLMVFSTACGGVSDDSSRPVGVKVEHLLGLPPSESISSHDFLDKVNRYIQADQFRSLQIYVSKWPRLTWSLLSQASHDQAGSKLFQYLARAYDASNPRLGADGWLQVLKKRSTFKEHYREYHQARDEMKTLIQQRRFRDAVHVGLMSKVPTWEVLDTNADPTGRGRLPKINVTIPLYKLDASIWYATALILDQQTERALSFIRQAIAQFENQYPYESLVLRMLHCEAWKQNGDVENLSAAWLNAAKASTRVLAQANATIDIFNWKRLQTLKPERLSWPDDLGSGLRQQLQFGQNDSSQGIGSELELELALAYWYLERKELRKALWAFKVVETSALSPKVQQAMRLGQAQTLVKLQQRDAAAAILGGLSQSADPGISRAALALLGVIEMKNERIKIGFSLLRRAVQEDANVDWHGRGKAVADLGIAYLLTGQEKEGLDWLRSAQEYFRSNDNDAMLISCLSNEIAYYEKKGMYGQAQDARRKLRAIEQF